MSEDFIYLDAIRAIINCKNYGYHSHPFFDILFHVIYTDYARTFFSDMIQGWSLNIKRPADNDK